MFQVQGKKTYAGQTASAAYHHFTGKECLDVHLLKPARVDILSWQPNLLCNDDDVHQPAWLEYPFRRVHPILRWSTVHCARQAPRGAAVRTKRFLWFISARLSLSN